jgi:hypothetical protein
VDVYKSAVSRRRRLSFRCHSRDITTSVVAVHQIIIERRDRPSMHHHLGVSRHRQIQTPVEWQRVTIMSKGKCQANKSKQTNKPPSRRHGKPQARSKYTQENKFCKFWGRRFRVPFQCLVNAEGVQSHSCRRKSELSNFQTGRRSSISSNVASMRCRVVDRRSLSCSVQS